MEQYFTSPWTRVVKTYALELLNKFEESDGATEHPTMEALLDGAPGWLEYSEGGCALIFEADLRERFRDTGYADGDEAGVFRSVCRNSYPRTWARFLLSVRSWIYQM